MRIAFLSGYDLLQPKLDRRIFIEARTCQDHGHDVEVICWARRQKEQIPEGEYESINFYRLHQDLGSESSSFLFKIPKYFRLMKQMLKRIDEFKPDVVIAVDLEMLPVATMGKLFYNYKLIYDCHEDWPSMESQSSQSLGFFTKLLEKSLLSFVDSVITVCETLQKRFLKAGKDSHLLMTARTKKEISELTFIPRQEVRKNLGFTDKDVLVGFIGNLKNKNLEMILEAFSHVQETDPNSKLKLLILGNPDIILKSLSEKAMEMNISNWVKFHPVVPYNEVHNYISALDLGITQYNEVPWAPLALPQKIIDYFAMGVPVLTRDFYERARLVRKSKAGVVFKGGNSQNVGNAILGLEVSNLLPKLRSQAKYFFQKKLCWEEQETKLISLLNSIDK